MAIWVDYREKNLLRLLPDAKEHTPPVGDIWIGDLSGGELLAGGVILERKTGADLEASILDGRYREQRGRLLTYAQTHNVSFGYVIEGILDRINGRLTEAALLKHLTRLQFHHKIPVFQTASLQETARLVTLICQQVKDPKHKGEFAYQASDCGTRGNAALSYVKSACRDTPEAFYVGAVTQCRGVSEDIARALYKVYPTLGELLTADTKDIASIPHPTNTKRKIGNAVATRLLTLARGGNVSEMAAAEN